MKHLFIIGPAAAALAIAGIVGLTVAAPPANAAVAGIQTAKFAIAHMTCATCPITVKKAMQGVSGVRSVDIDFAAKTATVLFDPARTSAPTIAAASTDAGYPATLAR